MTLTQETAAYAHRRLADAFDNEAHDLDEHVSELEVLVLDVESRSSFSERARNDWARLKWVVEALRYDIVAMRSQAKEERENAAALHARAEQHVPREAAKEKPTPKRKARAGVATNVIDYAASRALLKAKRRAEPRK